MSGKQKIFKIQKINKGYCLEGDIKENPIRTKRGS